MTNLMVPYSTDLGVVCMAKGLVRHGDTAAERPTLVAPGPGIVMFCLLAAQFKKHPMCFSKQGLHSLRQDMEWRGPWKPTRQLWGGFLNERYRFLSVVLCSFSKVGFNFIYSVQNSVHSQTEVSHSKLLNSSHSLLTATPQHALFGNPPCIPPSRASL